MADAPEDLNDLYTDELQDLWSANDQMQRLLKKLGGKASDPKLKGMLSKSPEGIIQHTELLKSLLKEHGEKVEKERCKGMEGLVNEATKHTVEEAPDKGAVLDAVIIAQYQWMTHYGIAGFGTAAAYAKALGFDEDAEKLRDVTSEIYSGDADMTQLADTAVNLKANDE